MEIPGGGLVIKLRAYDRRAYDHKSESKAQPWYRRVKETKQSGMDDWESEHPIVPKIPGNQPKGPGGGKGVLDYGTVGEKDDKDIGL